MVHIAKPANTDDNVDMIESRSDTESGDNIIVTAVLQSDGDGTGVGPSPRVEVEQEEVVDQV